MSCPVAEDAHRGKRWSVVRKDILHELRIRGGLHELTVGELDQLLCSVKVTTDEVYDYLKTTDQFVDGWKALAPNQPGVEVKDSDLYQPMTKILNSILERFHLHEAEELKVVNALEQDPTHQQVFDSTKDVLKLCPPLRAVQLDNHYFRSAKLNKSLSCFICATPIEVKAHRDNLTEYDEEEYLARCAAYARHYLYQQTGRHFLYVPLITDQHIRIFRFDRLGAVRSPWIDIHKNPETFIRLVLLTCGQVGPSIGANPAITWNGGTQYITVSGVKYTVDKELYALRAIRGRGPAVWRVFDPEGQPRIIKFSWRPKRPECNENVEWGILEDLKGVQGVVQIIDHAENEKSLLESRGFLPEIPFHSGDRLSTFTVLKCYGKRIRDFDSPLQFLQAFRDAIAGHQNIWREGILHRDISEGNILLGEEGAGEGFRGVIIDLDRGIRICYSESLPEANALYGTRCFQSLNLIRSELPRSDQEPYHSHTYIDDLQSFMWTFIWIITHYEVLQGGQSSRIRSTTDIVTKFQSTDAVTAETAKVRCLENPSIVKTHESYPPQFDLLKTQLLKFFAHYALHQPKTRQNPTPEDLSVVSEFHYKRILGWFDDAISSLQSGTEPKAEDLVLDFSLDDKEIAQLQEDWDRSNAFESLVWSLITSNSSTSTALQESEHGLLQFMAQRPDLIPPPPSSTPPAPVFLPSNRSGSQGASQFTFQRQPGVSADSSTSSIDRSMESSHTSSRDYPVFRPIENLEVARSVTADHDNDMTLKRGRDNEENCSNVVGKRSKA
ncbi:hypothetical protein CVT24_011361 [Panaeolus cyanescens]|uniref:Protein kinase domain-containing protein n=1 Tax=Panaeolus cyanescens TaxID=181874 RepID=A0A409YGM8_9AGAR|nr:hypothetical protein CVT24_011361 [Panaeolus cyanescens]